MHKSLNKDQPLVSVVITTHNRSNLLKRSLRSVINQTYTNIEIIVVDDASSNETLKVIREYQKLDNRIIYLRNDIVSGANVSRNKGIQKAKGTYIAGLDDDDEFLPTRIKVLLQNYDSKYSFVSSYNMIVRHDGSISYIGNQEIISYREILSQNLIGNQALILKSRLIEIGLYDENLVACQDYDIWLRLIIKYGEAKIVPEYLQVIHEDDNILRISTKSKNKTKGYFQFYNKFKSIMSIQDRKYHLYNLYRIKGKPLSKNFALTIVDENNYEKVLHWHVVNRRTGYNVLISFYRYISQLPRDKQYILYGYGSVGKLIAASLKDNIVGVIDSSIKGQTIDDFLVLKEKDLIKYQNVKVLITPIIYKDEIKKKIELFHSNFEVVNLLI